MVLERLVRWFIGCIDCYGSNESLILACFSVAAVFAFVAQLSGLSFGIGAFLAGSLVASVEGFRKIEGAILPFSSVFSSIFFFTIGMLFDWKVAFTSVWLLVGVGAINAIAKFAGTSLSTYFFGYDSKKAVFSGIAMLPVGEFSILLASQAAPFSSIDLVSVMSATVLISTMVSSVLLKKEDAIDNIVKKFLPEGNRGALKNISRYFNNIIVYFEPGGKCFERFLHHSSKAIFSASVAAIAIGSMIIFGRATEHVLGRVGGVFVSDILYAAGALLAVMPALSALKHLKEDFYVVAEAFLQNEGRKASLANRAERSVGLFVLFFVIAFLTPGVLALMHLPAQFFSIALVPFAISIIFLVDISRVSAHVIKKRHLKRRIFS